jgi:HlyD family secretion protein
VAEAARAVAEREAAHAAVDAAEAELAAARAAVQEDGDGADRAGPPGVLRAPVAGQVLAVHQASAGPVSAGQPLVDVGDLARLEVRVDVLSEDAVRIAPGTRVLLDQWGGDGSLEATVRRVEPQGFTEVSSLGVEEKRVTVVARLEASAAARGGLGVGYRVLARFVIWEGDDVLQVPSAALFRAGDGWAAFVVEDGRAVRRAVTVGHESGLTAEVLEGLTEGETVVVHPGNALEDGSRVEPRGSEEGGG